MKDQEKEKSPKQHGVKHTRTHKKRKNKPKDLKTLQIMQIFDRTQQMTALQQNMTKK